MRGTETIVAVTEYGIGQLAKASNTERMLVAPTSMHGYRGTQARYMNAYRNCMLSKSS